MVSVGHRPEDTNATPTREVLVSGHHAATHRGLHWVTQAALVMFSLLTLLGVIALFVLATETERYFAWTIQPPVTAAFLGAAYASGCLLVVLSIRTRSWVNARLPVVTILLFSVLTLIATLLHRDRFHFAAEGGVARPAAWFWLCVYIAVPLVLLIVLVVQQRTPGTDPPRELPLPRWLAGLLIGQGLLLVIVGAILYVAPSSESTLWPWQLTPLTARATAAWVISYGVAAILATWENCLLRLRIATLSYAVFGALELVVVARFPSDVRWSQPSAWLFCIVAVLIIVTGGYGWMLGRRSSNSVAAPGLARR
jgi:hypothetical protein